MSDKEAICDNAPLGEPLSPIGTFLPRSDFLKEYAKNSGLGLQAWNLLRGGVSGEDDGGVNCRKSVFRLGENWNLSSQERPAGFPPRPLRREPGECHLRWKSLILQRKSSVNPFKSA